MARYTGPMTRKSRRLGVDLVGGDSAFEKRPYAPGQHGKGGRIKSKLQGYGLQLREKQKVKRIYGLLEKQFRLTFQRASNEKGVVGENLLSMLERRLDNVVFRLGLANSRAQARQLVSHGHVRIADKKVNIPSYQVQVGQVITLAPRLMMAVAGALAVGFTYLLARDLGGRLAGVLAAALLATSGGVTRYVP